MKLLMLITSKLESGIKVATTWQKAGAPGVTVVPSYGLYTLQKDARDMRVELPRNLRSVASAAGQVMKKLDHTNHIILSAVPKEMIDHLIELAQEELGDLLSPYTGIVLVFDIERAIGVIDHSQDAVQDDEA